jgi:histone H3/H4
MILLALGAGSSLADEPRVPGSPPNPRTRMNQRANVFQRLDANKDGQVSKPEFERVARKAAQKRAQGKAGGATNQGARVFNRLDTDKSGTLSPAEIEKLKQMRARQKGGR